MLKPLNLPNPLTVLWTTALEKTLNGLIQLDPFCDLTPLNGKVIQILLSDFHPPGAGDFEPSANPKTEKPEQFETFGSFFLIFQQNQIAVQSQLQGEPDATLITDLYSLQHLKDHQGLKHSQCLGDQALAEQLIQHFVQLNPDWEEPLSRTCGDLIAFQISHLIRRLLAYKQRQRQYLGNLLAEYLHYEINLLPTRSQLQTWQQQLQQTQTATDRLEQRLTNLTNHLKQHTQNS